MSQTGGSSNILNPDLQSPQVIEATAIVERELLSNFSARVSYVYKREYNLYQTINVARRFGVFDVPITTVDPRQDGVVGTADDGKAITYYDYSPAYRGSAFQQNSDTNTPGYSDHSEQP